jgi:3-oxoacyl-[acyl-carrier-protein] synthase II
MSMALRKGRLTSEDLDYVNAHATSTPVGDAIEGQAIERVFGEHRSKPLYVSSTKGATGHLLGAAGAIEAAFTVMVSLRWRGRPLKVR